MKTTLNIYMAAQAVMYLPVYLAQEKGIFSTLLHDYDTDVNLISAGGGDKDAIKRMNEDNLNNDKTTFAIAIADPNAVNGIEDAKIIGSLIDRLSFWAISKKDIDCHLCDGIKNTDFNKIVHYDENLITGYKIGRIVREKSKIEGYNKINTVGVEFEDLKDDSIIITPDLLSIAHKCVNNEAFINYHFAKADRYMPNTYITTAIITSGWCIEKKTVVLVRVIEAIQKAKSIIYSSQQIAREILLNMECIRNSAIALEKQKPVADFIIQIINDDRIYPSDLNISKCQWELTDAESNLDYSQFVYNEIVLQAERCIADQFGITFNETFADRLSEIENRNREKIDKLESTISLLNDQIIVLTKKIEKLNNGFLRRVVSWWLRNWMSVLSILCLIYIIVWGVFYFAIKADWPQDPVAYLMATVVAIPIIINIVTNYRKKSQNKYCDEE